ncbi:MAG: hypothetical protein ACD_67C00160G0001 [uncultured bacterium]|nr:MAG: hypothetical protein ACD_67C00160G0001 [uncultured bacterium]
MLPFWVVGSLAALNFVGAYFFLPETHNNREHNQKAIPLNPLIPIFKALKDDALRSRYMAWFLFGVAFAGMQSIFALFVKSAFGFSAVTTGYLFTGMGVVLVINQAFALNKIWLKYFKEADLEIWFFVVMIAGFVFADLKIMSLFLVGIFLTTVGQSTLRVVMSSGVAGVAGQMRRGEVMGIMASIISASMIVGPLLAGALFQKNIQFPFLMNIILLVVAFLIMKKCCRLGGKIKEEVEVQALA